MLEMTQTPAGGTGQVRLRPYQQQAVHDVYDQVESGTRRVLLVAATGAGKTSLAGHITSDAVSHGQRVLFIAHRRELISQAYFRFRQFGLNERQVGVIMAQDPRWNPGAVVQVASIDTLRNRPKPRADIVFIDEAHRALAKSYRDVADHYSNSVHIGLTATPYRANGRGLGDMYDSLVVVASPQKLIDQGFLVEPRVLTVPDSVLPDLSSVRVRNGDYEQRALENAVDSSALIGHIVEHWLEHARDVRTVAFAVSVEHSKHIVARFRVAGIAAEHLDGKTPAAERDAILARLESGETRVVSNCGCLCEGWDQPAVKCVILARPTKSTGLYLQQAGRILRPWNEQKAIILDHAGCAIEHGLPQDNRVFSLEDKPKKKSNGGSPPAKMCPQCNVVLHASLSRCPECGHKFQGKEFPKEQAGKLIEIPSDPKERRQKEWNRLCALAEAHGYKRGWAYYRFREKFGVAPPSSYRPIIRSSYPSNKLGKAFRDAIRNRGGKITWNELTETLQ